MLLDLKELPHFFQRSGRLFQKGNAYFGRCCGRPFHKGCARLSGRLPAQGDFDLARRSGRPLDKGYMYFSTGPADPFIKGICIYWKERPPL